MKKTKKISIIIITGIMITLTIIASICKRTFNNSYSLNESDNKASSYVGQGFHAGYVEQALIDLIRDSNEVLKIRPNNDDSTDGWCMQHGASLRVNSGTISAEEDGYILNNAKSGYNGSIQWLLDNICRIGKNVSSDENGWYRNNLQRILDDENVNINVTDRKKYSDDKIFTIEQYVFWSLTNGIGGAPYNPFSSDPLYIVLKKKAEENKNYTSYRNTNVSINTENAKVNSNGVIGPFELKNNNAVAVTATLNGVNTTIYTDENCTQVLKKYNVYNGNIYIKTDDITSVNINFLYKFFNTTARFFRTQGNGSTNQPFLNIYRTVKEESVEFKSELKGEYNLSIVKKDQDDENDNNENEKYKDALEGAEFQVQQYKDKEDIGNADGNGYTENDDTVKSYRGTSKLIKFGTNKNDATSQIKISNEGFDTYTIKETKSPEGYYNERDFTSKLKVYKSINSNADSFVISKIAFYNNESDNNAIEIDVPSTGSSWLKINKDGNRVDDTSKDYLIAFEVTSNSIVITYKNTKLSGQYGVQIKKINESENNAPVQGVKFKVNNETKGPTNEQGIATVEENKEITKDNVSQTDKYEITEVDLGENNLVKLKNGLIVYVTKSLDESNKRYIVSGANFEYGDQATNSGNIVEKDVTLDDESETKAKLQIINNIVTITIPNTVKGDYKLSVGKKSTEDSKYLNNNNNDFISGASFEVKQYLNKNIDTKISKLKQNDSDNSVSISSEDKKSTDIKFNNKEKVDITDINTVDIYRITEESAPAGFIENSNPYYLKVYKTIKNHKAVIDKVEVLYYVLGLTREEKSIIEIGTIKDGDQTSSIVWGGSKSYSFRVDLNKETNSIIFTIGDTPKNGTYNFRMTKTDVTKKVIESEKTEFNLVVYGKMTEQDGKVIFYNGIQLKNYNTNEVINTNKISAKTGVTTDLNSIKIQKEDIGKTYYFVITETNAPDDFTKIDYKIVVPVTFSENENGYVATKGDAFAITSTNEKKQLNEMSTDVNEVVSTEQTGVTINVNVPNKQEIEKTVVKKWRGDENALGNRPNTITVELVKNGKTVDEQILSKDNNWTYTWKKLNKYENAKEINYTIREKGEVRGYVSEEPVVDGNTTTLTNTKRTELGEYNIYLKKQGINEEQLGGVEFAVKAQINGNKETEIYTEDNPLETKVDEAVQIGDKVTIDKDKISTDDVYILKELSVGNNSEYYIGIDKEIKLKLKKKKTDIDKYTTKYYVDRIDFEITNGFMVQNYGTKSIIQKTINNQTITIVATLENNTINIVVQNPKYEEKGEYEVRLKKVGKETNKQLGGVKFAVKAKINGNNEKEIYTEKNPLTTKANETVQIGDTVTIEKDKVNTDDIYTLKEISVGNNSGYYIGITDDIKLIVEKGSKENQGAIESYVNAIALQIGNGTPTDKGATASKLVNVDGENVEVKAELKGNTVTLTVENPKVQENGDYNLKIVKKGTDGKQLGGVSFTANAIINGNNVDLYTSEKPLKTDASEAVQIGSNVTIDKNQVTNPDIYTLKEVGIGNNAGYYIGIRNDIKLTINKKTEKSPNGGEIKNSVSGVSLEIEGATVVNENNKSTATVNIDGQDVKVIAELNGNTVTLTVENPPIRESGTYSINLVKKGTDEKQLGGVTFDVNAKINGESKSIGKIVTNDKSAVQIGDVVTINKNYIGTQDEYTLKEKDIGSNTGYYIGIKNNIKLMVSKTSETSSDGSKITYKVSGISLEVKGAKEVVNNGNKSTATFEINGEQVKVEAELSGGTITVTVYNPQRKGSFSLNLIKYKKGSEKRLSGAGFTVKIQNKDTGEILKDSTGTQLNGNKQYFVDSNGNLKISGINIAKAGITYEVTITEKTVPNGYLGLPGSIYFEVVSKIGSNNSSFVLTPETPTVQNAKNVDVKEGEILVEAENIQKPEIHKGVKSIDNLDSGYYGNVSHDWVIQSTVPTGIAEFTEYVITDTIDSRLKFSGTSEVTVKIGDKTLKQGTDYLIDDYSSKTRLLKISFINGGFTAGKSLPENSTIEIRFKTTFAKDANGKIIALNEEVPNQATLEYNNGSGKESKKSEIPEVHTGGIKILKFKTENGQKVPVSGAVFKIATSEENAKNNIFVKVKDKNGKDTTTDVTGKSGSDGIVEFTGLEFGGDASANKANKKVGINGTNVYDYNYDETISTKYWIVETTAPEGYIRYNKPIEVTITKDSYNAKLDDMVSVENTVINGRYSIELKKVKNSGKKPISNISFDISSKTIGKANRKDVKTDSNGILNITNGDVTIVANNVTANKNNESNLNTNDEFYIEEKNAETYLKLRNRIKLTVKKEKKSNKYQVSKIFVAEEKTKKTVTLDVSKNKTVTLNGVALKGSDKTVSITVSIDDNNNISVTIPNEDLNGEYKIELVKKSEDTGKIIGNVPFLINNVEKNTDAQTGKITVTDGNNGIVAINRSNVDNKDVYTIQEQKNENTKKYTILSDPITLTVSKGTNTDDNAYIVTEIGLSYTSSSGQKEEKLDIDKSTGILQPKTINVKTESGEDTKCEIKVDTNGEIIVTLGNPTKGGSYALQLRKKIIKNDNTEEDGNNVTFVITPKGGNTVSRTTKNGLTDAYYKQITNVNEIDEYTITEDSVNSDTTIKLKNSLNLKVSKKISQNDTEYVIDTIELSEENTNNTTGKVSIVESNGGSATLSGVQLVDGRTVDIGINVNAQGSVVIDVKNREMNGKYTIKVRKLDSVTNEPINGVNFKGTKRDKSEFDVTTKEETTANGEKIEGIATIDENVEISGENKDTYVINEVNLPDELKGKYVQLTDYNLVAKVTTKMNESKTGYVVGSVTLSPEKVGDSATLDIQKQIILKSKYDVVDNIITITIYNEPTQDFKFNIKKVNMKNESIKDAKFTIKENGVEILNNQPLSDIGEYFVERKNQLINKTYTYEIYETEAAPGYKNTLEKVYLALIVKISEKGTVSAKLYYRPIRSKGGTVVDVMLAKALAEKYYNQNKNQVFKDNGNNSWTLIIPNERAETSYKFKLNKHELSSEKGVDGAKFNVKRLYIEENNDAGMQLSDIVNKFSAGTGVETLPEITTSSDNTDITIDNVEKIKLGGSYYYELEESTVPNNYFSSYKKALVRVHAKIDGTIASEIIAIMAKDSDQWTAYNKETQQNTLSVTQDGDEVKINWANTLVYTVTLNKKQFKGDIPKDEEGNIKWTGLQGISGAEFTVKQVEPEEKVIYNKKYLSSFEIFSNDQASIGTRYHYEIVENASIDGYTNIFEGLTIHLFVTINSDGTINKSGTYYQVRGYKSVAQKKYLEDKIGIDLDENRNVVNLYIANEENTLKLAVMKTAEGEQDNKIIGLEGVEFSVMAPNGTLVKDKTTGQNPVTDKNGYIYIDGISLNSGIQRYVLTEQNVPEGVTKLNDTQIIVEIDTTGITSAEKITDDKVSIEVSRTSGEGLTKDELIKKGLSVYVQNSTVVLRVPNKTETHVFRMFKYDEIGNIINNSNSTNGAIFKVEKIDEDGKSTILKAGSLDEGLLVDYEKSEPNKTYTYKITERDPKIGYINVLQGYDLYVYIQTDENGRVKDTASDGLGGYTHYELKERPNAKTLYTIDELINKKIVKLTVAPGDVKSTIDLNIVNPYAYNLVLNKQSKNGEKSIDKATIVAEQIGGAKLNDLYYAGVRGDNETVKNILKEVVSSNNVTKTVELNKRTSVKSDNIEIKNNIGIDPKDETAQIWRIKETDVDSPYINVLGNNYIIVQTIYRDGELKIITHDATINGSLKTLNYYVCNENGEDVTANYLNSVTAEIKVQSTNSTGAKYALSVIVKDPLKFYVDLNKTEYNAKAESEDDLKELSGAELSMSAGSSNVKITSGASKSDPLGVEVGLNEVTDFMITETKTAPGHTNILKDKILHVMVRMNEKQEVEVAGTVLVDTSSGTPKVIQNAESVLKYIRFVKGTTDKGYPIIHVYVENPIEYRFNLKKLDTEGNLLSGTEFEVTSSNSGKHYLNGNNQMTFTEENLEPGMIVSYQITEKNTVENSAYENVFNKALIMVLKVNEDGTLTELMSFVEENSSNGGHTKVPLKNLDFLEYGISDSDSEGIQTVYFTFENPTTVDVELLKKQTGENGAPISNTEFTIISSFSGTYRKFTDQSGKIGFSEKKIPAGKYSYIVTENNVANANYVNILSGKYMKIDVTVSANGKMTIDNTRYYNDNNDENYENDKQITDDATLKKLQKYTSVMVDDKNVINKLLIEVKNPVTIELNINKTTTAGTPLKDVEFNITSELQSLPPQFTNDDGNITVDGNVWIEPGVYKYEVTEKTTAGKQYDNLLEGNKIVFFAKISPDGTITLVADKNGTAFDQTTQYKYFVQKQDGSEADYNTRYRVYNHISLNVNANNSIKDSINMIVENTVGYTVDITKRNAALEELKGTKFSVIRDGNVVLLNNGEVTSGTEITERYMSEGYHTYDITENSTIENSAYVNILEGKFIRVYTELTDTGVLKIKDQDGNTSKQYFEIYEGNMHNTRGAKLLDRNEYKDLYNKVSVRAEDYDQDGIYKLSVAVINPVSIFVEVQKQQVGKNGEGIPNTKFSIVRDENSKHEGVFTNDRGTFDFKEEEIKTGDYTYTIKELEPASSKYVNILQDKYVEVYIRVKADGSIIIRSPYRIFNSDGTEVDSNTKVELFKYISVSVNTTEPIQRLIVKIYNPTTIDFNLYKENIEGTPINGANFTIKRTLVKEKTKDADFSTKEVTDNTKNDGSIEIKNKVVLPGVYKYEVTENNSAGNQYINILENCKIIAYVDVAENGDTTVVADSEGTKFGPNAKYKYYIENKDGSVADAVLQERIHKYVTIGEQSVENSNDEVDLRVINPVKYNLSIEKSDSKKQALNGSKFTVIRDDQMIIDNQELNPSVEVSEEYLTDGEHTYYITENDAPEGYINLLKGKFIKVYTELTGDGVVKIKDQDFNVVKEYFEIYEGDIQDISSAKLLEKSKYKDLYNSISIGLKNNNGLYTLNIGVQNPERNYKLVINKKIFGEENINLSNTKFTVVSEFSGRHSGLVTDKNGNISFTEYKVPEGTYRYLITETRTAGKQFVNILEGNVYIEVILKVNEDGTITIVDEEGNAVNDQYYLYKQRKDSNLLDKLDFEDTVADAYINVSTGKEGKVPTLNVFIKDPEFYNFELIKKDKDTNERMNGVKFKLTVFDEKGKKVNLKDAETLENLVQDTIETKKVNNEDGVILLPKILIEKAGTYKFVLHEESTDGIFDHLYKTHESDIVVNVKIVVKNNEYIIETPSVAKGNKYVDLVNASTSKSQIAKVEVTNERIKGSYNLIIDKLDSYTNKPLKGAEFDVSVEKDGKAYELYKSTEDVNSKDVIIPGKVTVNSELIIPNIRIDRPETYTIILKETKAPKGYMLLDNPIKIKVTTARSGQYDDEKYIVESVELTEGDNYGLVTVDGADNEIDVIAKNEYFDLALRKSITTVSYSDSEDSKITQDETKDRVPDVKTGDLLANKTTTATYNHVKNCVRAYVSQDVVFTLRVYNEGEIDGYAQEITDYLPEGLEFVEDEFNNERGWKLDSENKRVVKTTKLSKEENAEKNLIKAKDKVTGELDYKEIEIKCRISKDVPAKTVLTNIAEISKSIANNRTSETIDRDSVTNNVKVPETSKEMSDYNKDKLSDNRNNYVPGQEDDDDFEKVIVEEFDLALRKYITAVNDEELLKEHSKEETKQEQDVTYERAPRVNVDSLKDGSNTTATYTHTKEPVEVSVGDIVTYTLQVYNEGTVSGYASLIKDDIPEGLEFVPYVDGDGSINDTYKWKMVDENNQEVTDTSKAKYVISDYLSKANEKTDEANLIKAFDPDTMDTLDSKYVKIAFKVICKQDYPKIIENQAQIADDTDESGKPVTDRDSTPNEWKGEDDEDVEYIKVTYMDLALRKFITGVNKEEVTSRIPQVDATALINETGTTATYTHPKDPVLVHTNDIVTYTIRVYNEGSKDGYATGIKDDIPEGLEYLPDNEINQEYEWKLVDENDNEVTDVSKAKYVVTNYLSKENETKDRQNLMKAFDKETMTTPEYKDVKIAFKVTEPTTSDRILINYAQISEQTDKKGIHREDRDSTPNVWKGEDDEDIEKVRVLYFDLALRKWVTEAYVTENGQTRVIETGHHAEDDPEEVVKVDLRKSKLDSVVVKFRYHIRITNEGEIAGYAKEIKDRIPEGLEFELSDNPNWTMLDDGTIVTDELKDTLLQPGESAEVTIVLKWINSETNIGVKINVAEICKDYNDYRTPDIDSTPDNNVPGEDDIDDAPVMLTVKTGSEDLKYIALITIVLALLSGCVIALRKNIKRQYNVGDILRK
ncbi:MAG TPA: SpaH/EbpB family LPXTG-anchored major pilin [Clostridiaceae bacterium]|nr:SpaH/EbpB family LPXTG-anchored major pilin [Clostridiaceae bacterium]